MYTILCGHRYDTTIMMTKSRCKCKFVLYFTVLIRGHAWLILSRHASSHLLLQTLLLHDNQLSTLKTFPRCLPHGLVILSLAQNQLRDLSEVHGLGRYIRRLHSITFGASN